MGVCCAPPPPTLGLSHLLGLLLLLLLLRTCAPESEKKKLSFSHLPSFSSDSLLSYSPPPTTTTTPVVVSSLQAIAHLKSFGADHSALVTDLMDVLDQVFTTLVRLGLFETATEEKDRTLTALAEDVEIVLAKRQKTPEHLKAAFLAECRRLRVEALGLDQFVALVNRITESSGGGGSGAAVAGGRAMVKRREELETIFVKADVDGNGKVDLYEFVLLYQQATAAPSPGRPPAATALAAGPDFKGTETVEVEATNVLHNQGHRLHLRTVECGERVVVVRQGKGHEPGVS